MYRFFHDVLADAARLLHSGTSLAIAEQAHPSETGIPDFRVASGDQLKGWMEVKAVVGKPLHSLSGRDKAQLQRFTDGLHNLVLTNGWEWRLYRDGRQLGRDVVLGPPGMFDPDQLPSPLDTKDVAQVAGLLEQFFAATSLAFPDADAAVVALATRAKALQSALLEVGEDGAGAHLAQLKSDFEGLLYKNGQPFTWERFVDSYVQLATFGTLLWRLETSAAVSLSKMVGVRPSVHPLLAQCMSILWNPQARLDILTPLLEELCNTVNLIDPTLFARPPRPAGRHPYLPDPVVEAYEPFFKKYDPAAREASGVYYTPVEIVEQIVSGVAFLLRRSLGLDEGLLDDQARFLDPATGTGTFLLGLINAVGEEATAAGLPPEKLVKQIIEDQSAALEVFPGPYTVAHQRVETALRALGASPTKRLPIYLADTLAAPTAGTLAPSGLGPAGLEIEKERMEADRRKTTEEILVILGNPPYGRVRERRGAGFERFALDLFLQLKNATPLDHRADLKSTADLFVAFWLWALWALQPPAKRLETAGAPAIDTTTCHGLIGFISNRTWILGRSLAGLRRLVRQGATEVWVCDLGGDNRGSHGAKSFAGGDANVFGIETGVAIVWAVFDRSQQMSSPTRVYYRRMYGTRSEKLSGLVEKFDPSRYEEVIGSDIDPFLPRAWDNPVVERAPALSELFSDEPDTGMLTNRDTKRYSPVGTQADEVLARNPTVQNSRWQLLGKLGEWSRIQSEAGRYTEWTTGQARRTGTRAPSPTTLDAQKVVPFVYRPLDVRYVYNDPAWVDWSRPALQAIYAGGRNVYSLVTIPNSHGRGPCVIHVSRLMDQHCFRGSAGGKGVFSLWHPLDRYGKDADPRGIEGDMRSGLSSAVYDWLELVGHPRQHEAAYHYLLAVLSAPKYSRRFWKSLEVEPLRAPLTRAPDLFGSLVDLGAELRTAWDLEVASSTGVAWKGKAGADRLGRARLVGSEIQFENGRCIEGATADLWDFEVSGYYVVRRWFAARAHWRATAKQAKEAIAVLSAAQRIVDLGPELDRALERLIAG